MTSDIPPLLPPGDMPAIHTQADLDRHWRALMGPLGFSQPLLWMMFISPDGRCDGPLTQIEEIPLQPDEFLLTNLLGICAQIIDESLTSGTRVAFLRSRPGSGTVNAEDIAWARGVTEAARAAGVPCEPFHLATDERVTVVAYDDLTRRSAS
ncbi:MAG TPA: hypothetical protein VFD59_20255 [Nocardioidaceae bacterium]|nr:hypothetical protein [Nocardioidaceae bacterium]